MRRPLTTLIFLISGFAFSILSILVDSQTQNRANFFDPPLIISSPPPSPPPRPPHSRQSPLHRNISPPPLPFSQPNRSPNSRRSPPNRSRNSHRSPPFPLPRDNINKKQGWKRNLNKGKKVGLSFVGVAGLLQICVVGFLVFKRRQLLRFKERYDGVS